MLEYVILIMLMPVIVLLGYILAFIAFGGFLHLMDWLCKDRKPKVLRTMDHPEQFWDTEYFAGYGTLIGRLNGKIVIFSNDRSTYKFVDEKEFLQVNPKAYDPINKYLLWEDDLIKRDAAHLGRNVI